MLVGCFQRERRSVVHVAYHSPDHGVHTVPGHAVDRHQRHTGHLKGIVRTLGTDQGWGADQYQISPGHPGHKRLWPSPPDVAEEG